MRKFIIISIIAALIAGCGASQLDTAISKVEKAIEKVEKNKGNMTAEEWEALGKELEQPLQVIGEAIESDKVGTVKKLKLIALAGKWSTVLMTAGFKHLGKELGVDVENPEDLEQLGKEFEKFANEYSEEINKAVEELEKSKVEN